MPSASGSDSSETGMASERTRAKRAPSGLPSTPSPARSAPIGVSPVGRPGAALVVQLQRAHRRCPRDRGEPERGSLERVGERGRVEPRAAEDVAALDDDRVVRGRVELELDGGAQPLERRPRAAVQHRGAAERQRILQQARPARVEQRAALERRADLRRRPGMTRERARRDDPRVGRRRVPLEALEREGDRGVRRIQQAQRVRGCERSRADRERVRRAERERVSRRELRQRDAGAFERPAALQDLALELGAAEPDERQREVCERRQIRLAHRADRGHDRVDAVPEHGDEGVGDGGRDARPACGDPRDPREEGGPHQLRRRRRADGRRASDEDAACALGVVSLEREADVRAEAGRGAVDARAGGRGAHERLVAREHAGARAGGERDDGAGARDGDHVVDGGRPRPELDGVHDAVSRARAGPDRSGPFEIGDDPPRIEPGVRHVVVALDLVDVDGLGDAGHLVELAREAEQVRVVGDQAQVALEVRVVDGIEADQRGEEAPVGLGDPVAVQVAELSETCLEAIERAEERSHRLVVGLLRAREAALVDAVVDVRVDLALELVDLVAQRLGVEIEADVGEGVELAPEHADDLGRLVVHDPVRLPVEEHRHRHVVGALLGEVVHLGEEVEAVQGVELGAGGARERPAALVADGVEDRQADRVLESLQAPDDDRAMRPRAGERDVQVVAARHGGVAG